MVNIPVTTAGVVDSAVITLNFPLAVGTGYQLGTNTAQNQTLLGTASPRLKRSNSNVTYPYAISNLVNITNSNQGATVYYYFFDWNVIDAPMVCPSPRHPQSVLFNTLGMNETLQNAFEVFPNPASETISIRVKNTTEAGKITLTDMLGKIVINTTVGELKKGQVVSINLQSVSKGVYFLHYTVNGMKSTQKIVVE